MVKKWRKKRAGKWVPEDRLKAGMFAAVWLIPLSLVLFGVANTFVDGTPGLVLCLVCLLINGIGVSFQGFAALLEWGLRVFRPPPPFEWLGILPVFTRPYQT